MYNVAMYIFIFSILGLVVGSFANVVIDRLNTGLGIVGGRSKCMSCHMELGWYDLLPFVSFFLLRGRCRSCGVRIGIRHVFVEVSTAFLFVCTYSTFGLSIESLLLLLVIPLLMAIFVYDIRHLIIPNVLVFGFIGLSILSLFVEGSSFVLPTLANFLAGVVPFVFFFLLWFVSKGTWMGFGDAKLVLGMGWFLGLFSAVHMVVYAFWLGAIYSIAGILYMKIQRSRKGSFGMKSLIPFGPFLIISFLVMVFVPFFVFVF